MLSTNTSYTNSRNREDMTGIHGSEPARDNESTSSLEVSDFAGDASFRQSFTPSINNSLEGAAFENSAVQLTQVARGGQMSF
jgi:hypothetical protein